MSRRIRIIKFDMAYYVYIISNKYNTTVYIGVTGNLIQRINNHKEGNGSWFSRRYNCSKLVYYESYDKIEDAIRREKQLKGWRRDKKNALICRVNPDWEELVP